MKSEVETQAVALKDWEKKDKDLKKKERYLKGQKVKLDADKRALEEKLDREHLSKKDVSGECYAASSYIMCQLKRF